MIFGPLGKGLLIKGDEEGNLRDVRQAAVALPIVHQDP